jgi:hypothetical protein
MTNAEAYTKELMKEVAKEAIKHIKFAKSQPQKSGQQNRRERRKNKRK